MHVCFLTDRGSWKPEGDGIVQKVAIPDQPVEGRSPSPRSYQVNKGRCNKTYGIRPKMLKNNILEHDLWNRAY